MNPASAEVSPPKVEICPAPVPKVSVCAVFEPTWTVSVLPEVSPLRVELKLLSTADVPKPSALPRAPPTVIEPEVLESCRKPLPAPTALAVM